MADVETVLETGVRDAEEYRLLVAVSNPETVDQLLRTARDLATLRNGSIHVVSVVDKPYQSPFRLFDDETIRREYASEHSAIIDRAIEIGDDADVEVTGSVVVARRAVDGILETVTDVDADELLVGWHQSTRPTETVLGTTVDALVERAPCDLLVERIGETADGVDSVLVPVADSTHAELATRVGYAIAVANDARVLVLSVATDDADRSRAHENVRTVTEKLTNAAIASDISGTDERVDGGDVADADDPSHERVAEPTVAGVDGTVLTDEDVVGAIVDEAEHHDVVAMGATRGGALRRRLVGSIAQQVARRSDCTLLLARRWTKPSRLTQLLGRFRRS
ncbi:universal stress protein [Natrialbaceae archaeon AArc-T1-2]|uniref:universal stress protein n=1 Tax=Natrialbaceae archaeon AArc-T1-2 TaxID=3053904 RepID=UPI00255AFC04|nr:universal stress protein [Natrialbaceae archaeon AArc-T1-2]WIV66153.1 universal stress protein [Natrialbaceae archaeon AArc-T1-2]